MSMMNPKNNKDGKKANKQTPNAAQPSKFIAKPAKSNSFVKKKINTGSQRGS